MKSATVIIIVLTLFWLNSCDKDKGPYFIENIYIPQDTTTPPPTVTPPTVFSYSISYNNDIKFMFQESCVQQCHNQQHPKLDLRPQVSYNQLLTDGLNAPYVNTISPEQSSLYLHLAGIYTLMPLNGPALSQGKIDTVYTWISQGALNN